LVGDDRFPAGQFRRKVDVLGSFPVSFLSERRAILNENGDETHYEYSDDCTSQELLSHNVSSLSEIVAEWVDHESPEIHE